MKKRRLRYILHESSLKSLKKKRLKTKPSLQQIVNEKVFFSILKKKLQIRLHFSDPEPNPDLDFWGKVGSGFGMIGIMVYIECM